MSQPSEFTAQMNALLDSADADQMVELIARTNAALPDADPRKIHGADVRMLRRLAGQARTLHSSLVHHAAERRLVGEPHRRVSPEARDTALWAERLATALERMVSSVAATMQARV
jgi:hypothetical protein